MKFPEWFKGKYGPNPESPQLALAAWTAGRADLASEVERLRGELAEVRAGYEALDRNWQMIHDAAMTPIRQAVGDLDASVPEIVERIGQLRAAVSAFDAAGTGEKG